MKAKSPGGERHWDRLGNEGLRNFAVRHLLMIQPAHVCTGGFRLVQYKLGTTRGAGRGYSALYATGEGGFLSRIESFETSDGLVISRPFWLPPSLLYLVNYYTRVSGLFPRSYLRELSKPGSRSLELHIVAALTPNS